MSAILNNAMRTTATKPSLVRRCALALAGAIALLTWHDSACAACGDYVLIRDAQGRLVPASQLRGGYPMLADPGAMPGSVPCRGPSCSRLPSSPPAVPLPPLKLPSPPEGLLAVAESEAAFLGGGNWLVFHLPLHPVHHPGRIFRPPRS